MNGWCAIPNVDVVLVEGYPPTVRAPDISIIRFARVRTHPKRYRADQIEVAVEIISPGSRRIDRILEVAEYAEARIPNYWIVELADVVTLDTCRLAGDTCAPVVRAATGTVDPGGPVPLTIDLAALVP